MANDGSLASQTEDWIVTQIANTEIDARQVEAFPGFLSASGQQLIEEMERKGSPYVAVLFEGDSPKPLEEGAFAYEPTYAVYVVVKNEREGTARRGDGTSIGTNKIRDILRTALHDKIPNTTAGGYHTDRTEFRGSTIVFQRADLFIQKCTVTVQESPTG